MTLRLNTAQLDRAAGVLLGMACGDALGAPFEFGPPLGPDVPVTMTGGGHFGWEPGEWTDDTSMRIWRWQLPVLTEWRRSLHGWPGLRARDLVRLAVMSRRHPADDGVCRCVALETSRSLPRVSLLTTTSRCG